jgi:hypothetical protein
MASLRSAGISPLGAVADVTEQTRQAPPGPFGALDNDGAKSVRAGLKFITIWRWPGLRRMSDTREDVGEGAYAAALLQVLADHRAVVRGHGQVTGGRQPERQADPPTRSANGSSSVRPGSVPTGTFHHPTTVTGELRERSGEELRERHTATGGAFRERRQGSVASAHR